MNTYYHNNNIKICYHSDMITIIHGDNLIASKDHLLQKINQAKASGIVINRIEASQLTRADLETKLIKKDLFGTEHLLVIEDLHSLPPSAEKKELISLVSQAQLDLILWEKKILTKSQLAKFPHSQNLMSKVSNNLFIWLEKINGSNKNLKEQISLFHKALLTEDVYLCFIMLIRQIRQLIIIKEGNKPTTSPWIINKLTAQARTFELDQLLKTYQKLLAIDFAQKTSTNSLELHQELDLILVNL